MIKFQSIKSKRLKRIFFNDKIEVYVLISIEIQSYIQYLDFLSIIIKLKLNHQGNEEMIKLLIKAGSKITAEDREGHTASNLVNRSIEHLLENVKTVPDKRAGCTALHKAVAERMYHDQKM